MYVGRLWKGKGIDPLRGFPAIGAGGPGASTLLLVGDGPEQDAIERVISKEALGISLPGSTERGSSAPLRCCGRFRFPYSR